MESRRHKNPNPYEVLGVPKNASDDDIKRAYRQHALQCHPDRLVTASPQEIAQAKGKFQEINHANSILSNPNRRKAYDAYGEMGIQIMDQIGEERFMQMQNGWLKCVFLLLFLLSCCCCCCFCCCLCCFNFCCGRFKPAFEEDEFEQFRRMEENREIPPVFNQPMPNNGSQSTPQQELIPPAYQEKMPQVECKSPDHARPLYGSIV